MPRLNRSERNSTVVILVLTKARKAAWMTGSQETCLQRATPYRTREGHRQDVKAYMVMAAPDWGTALPRSPSDLPPAGCPISSRHISCPVQKRQADGRPLQLRGFINDCLVCVQELALILVCS